MPLPGSPRRSSNNGHMSPRVCIIVLTWKNYELTRDCLLSLRQIDYTNTEVVLVDNGSGDGSDRKSVV